MAQWIMWNVCVRCVVLVRRNKILTAYKISILTIILKTPKLNHNGKRNMIIDLNTLDDRHAHDILTSCIIPRPIAWVSTIDMNGKINLAPFSFFTGVQWYPPILAFSPVNRSDGTKKDTVINIEQTKEFVINLVSIDLIKPMELSAKPLLHGEDESVLNDITFISSKTIKPNRIKEAKVSFECKLEKIIRINEGANAGNLILGRVVIMHINDNILLNGREVNLRALKILGRLSGNRYCTLDTIIESETN